MKYKTPKYELTVIETQDVITASSGFEISRTDEGEGKLQIDFSKLFG